MIFSKIRKKFGWYDLRKEGAKWVEKNIGPEYVDEFLEKYDKLNHGVPIGDLYETSVFINMINMIEQIKKDI